MSLKESKRVIIIHGEKPHKNCTQHREFLRRLERAIELASKGGVDGIIVSGGATRKNCPTEASFGVSFLQKKVSIPVFAEDNSRTTIENINFVKAMLWETHLEKLIVVSSPKRLLRLRYLYRRLWSEVFDRIEFIGVPDSYSIFYFLVEWTYLVYSILDIHERFLPRLTKKIFRNK